MTIGQFAFHKLMVAAKGVLKQLSKALAVDRAPYGLRVNNIGPGYFHTDMTSDSWWTTFYVYKPLWAGSGWALI